MVCVGLFAFVLEWCQHIVLLLRLVKPFVMFYCCTVCLNILDINTQRSTKRTHKPHTIICMYVHTVCAEVLSRVVLVLVPVVVICDLVFRCFTLFRASSAFYLFFFVSAQGFLSHVGYHPIPSAEMGTMNCSGIALGDEQPAIVDIAYWKVSRCCLIWCCVDCCVWCLPPFFARFLLFSFRLTLCRLTQVGLCFV